MLDKPSTLEVRKAHSRSPRAAEAVDEVARQLEQPETAVVALFVSPRYDRSELAAAIRRRFRAPVISCTTSGEITPDGYDRSSVTGFSIASRELQVNTYLIRSLTDFDSIKLEGLVRSIRADLSTVRARKPPSRAFGLLLVDGLSGMEERLAALLGNALQDIPIVGGSAGDDLDFQRTFVYGDGDFASNRALLSVFITTLPFHVIKTQHFVATETRVVITKANPDQRLVLEINGRPATEEYARVIGKQVRDLGPTVFSEYPLMLRLGGKHYVRSIQKANEDGSLTFFCAIDEGLVLRLARGENLVENLKGAFDEARRDVPRIKLTIGCDCILRRLEIQDKHLETYVNDILKENHVIGFNTYGEQYQSVHINQTFTGIVLGE
jgi:hypothetical protein